MYATCGWAEESTSRSFHESPTRLLLLLSWSMASGSDQSVPSKTVYIRSLELES